MSVHVFVCICTYMWGNIFGCECICMEVCVRESTYLFQEIHASPELGKDRCWFHISMKGREGHLPYRTFSVMSSKKGTDWLRYTFDFKKWRVRMDTSCMPQPRDAQSPSGVPRSPGLLWMLAHDLQEGVASLLITLNHICIEGLHHEHTMEKNAHCANFVPPL